MNAIEEAYISASTAKARGWTDSLIAELLGPPDAKADNPYSRWTQMSLYSLDRVQESEKDPRWIDCQKKRKHYRPVLDSMHVYTADGYRV
jgi:hypothetical protein